MTKRDWTDAELLDVLDRADMGESATVTGKRYGVSRSAILGLRHRCGGIADHHDGTMPKDWWRKGLEARA